MASQLSAETCLAAGVRSRAATKTYPGNSRKIAKGCVESSCLDWIGGCREEVLEFAIGGDLVDKQDEQIDVEVWDYHWVNKPGNLTWYDEWYTALLYMRSSPCLFPQRPLRAQRSTVCVLFSACSKLIQLKRGLTLW